MNENNNRGYVFGVLLTGLGTLLLGIAAWIALCKSDNVLDKILQVQRAIDELKQSNSTLQETSKEIQNGINAINQKLKNDTSDEIISKQTYQEKKKTLKGYAQNIDTLHPGQVYLPIDKLKLGEKILETNNMLMQRQWLNENLQIWKPKKEHAYEKVK
jgi:type II secretory pathway component PulM